MAAASLLFLTLLEQGAIRFAQAADTGFRSPAAEAAVTASAGDNDGFETTPTNAFGDGGGSAVDTNSGSATNSTCTGAAADKHIFSSYGFDGLITAGSTIDGIEVRADIAADSLTDSPFTCIELSWDGGATWTSAQSRTLSNTGETAYTYGGAANTWGRTWTISEVNNANFRVRVANGDTGDGSSPRDFSLDWLPVKVYYTAPPAAAFSAAASSGAESVTPANLTVNLSSAFGLTVTVDYAVTGGTATGGGVDYTLAAGTLTFVPTDISETIPITIVNDALDEANETIQVTLSNPSNATLGATTVHTYTINDDENPAVAFATASSGDSEAATPANLTVTLSAASTQTITVDYAVTGGSTATGGGVDYTLAAGTLTFVPDDTSETIPIAIVNDERTELHETIEVTLSNPANAALGAITTHVYTIFNDDLLPPPAEASPTATPTATPSPTPGATPSPTPTASPMPTPSPKPTASPAASPTATPVTPAPTPSPAPGLVTPPPIIRKDISITVPANAVVTSDLEADGATIANPVEVTITMPVSGTVSISIVPITAVPPAGFAFIGAQAEISAPPADPSAPLLIVFLLSSTAVPPGVGPLSVQVFKDGAPVQDCLGNILGPDPCLLSKGILPSNNTRFVVLSAFASTWNFGVALQAGQSPTPAPGPIATPPTPPPSPAPSQAPPPSPPGPTAGETPPPAPGPVSPPQGGVGGDIGGSELPWWSLYPIGLGAALLVVGLLVILMGREKPLPAPSGPRGAKQVAPSRPWLADPALGISAVSLGLSALLLAKGNRQPAPPPAPVQLTTVPSSPRPQPHAGGNVGAAGYMLLPALLLMMAGGLRGPAKELWDALFPRRTAAPRRIVTSTVTPLRQEAPVAEKPASAQREDAAAAPPMPPTVVTGVARVDGQPAAGRVVTAFIEGEPCGSAVSEAEGRFTLAVASPAGRDDRAGAVITFTVGEAAAQESATREFGALHALDLTALTARQAPLSTGLNLVSYNGRAATVEEALAGCRQWVEAVFTWNASEQSYRWWFKAAPRGSNSLEFLRAGDIVWVRASAPCQWRQL